jgi:hypothetical protein
MGGSPGMACFLHHQGWWIEVIHKRGEARKAMSSSAMLVSWEFWKERKARVFQNHSITLNMLVTKIKDEMAMWCLSRAKALSNVMSRDFFWAYWTYLVCKISSSPSLSRKNHKSFALFQKKKL